VISLSTDDSKVVAQHAAKAILRLVNPYVLAAYLSNSGDSDSAIEIVESMVGDPSQDRLHRRAAYNGWGNALEKLGRNSEAREKFEKLRKL